MTDKHPIVRDLVIANRILANESIVDAYGHVSIRHPDKPNRFFLARSLAPELVDQGDIIEFTLEGEPVNDERPPYLERFIHGAIYEARPDVNAVVHNHSPSVLPFGVIKQKLKPLHHMCGCMGHEVPTWDSQTKFGDTSLLVSSIDMGRDLAKLLGDRPAALMRGHGCVIASKDIREAVYIAYYLELAAKLQMQAMPLGSVKYLTEGEIDKVINRTGPYTLDRA